MQLRLAALAAQLARALDGWVLTGLQSVDVGVTIYGAFGAQVP